MNELQEMVDKQADLNLQMAQTITALSKCVDLLTERVVQLEEDMKRVLENQGIRG